MFNLNLPCKCRRNSKRASEREENRSLCENVRRQSARGVRESLCVCGGSRRREVMEVKE